MIRKDSVLRRLPANMDRRQVLFLDGIRHAGEIATLAMTRLRCTLTTIANEAHDVEMADGLYTSAFLDAWALVDVIDRFRTLWSQLPGRQRPVTQSSPSFAEIAQPVRNLRNVADHLAQRADYVVAHRGSALGVLSWYTVMHSQIKDSEIEEALFCAIVPGSWHPEKMRGRMANPAGESIELPSGFIHLSAGEFTANLSAVIPHMESRIDELERSLEENLQQTGGLSMQGGSDSLLKLAIKFSEETSRESTKQLKS